MPSPNPTIAPLSAILFALSLGPTLGACGDDSGGGDLPGVDGGARRDSGVEPGSDAGTGEADPFIVDFDTTAGAFAVEVDPSWAPLGAARFRELVEAGYYDGSKFFRVVPGFVVQFGLAADPAVTATWQNRRIDDDPVNQSNTRGYVTFATAGPNTRTTQLFINYGNNAFLDAMGFAPIGRVVEGMSNVDAINAEYGEAPSQARISSEGNEYLESEFPRLTTLTSAGFR